MEEPYAVTILVVHALEVAGAAYFIGGSIASGLYSPGRATMDADIIAPLGSGQVEAFLKALGPDFYADADMILEAVTLQRSFNVIHLPTMFKVDIFILGSSAFAQEEFKRRKLATVGEEHSREAYFATAEDVILSKLRWFRDSGCSERQWKDVLGLLKTQGDRLDMQYLHRWAAELGLEAELAKAVNALGL